jgi:UDP-GlcNAc:undecaprenyl-phosphate GlcNAc-1-phosphate transferase
MLIGLLIGVIGVQGSMGGPSAISILFPIVAMGLPISDTAMAIFRRWVRNLPLSAADRRHIHHLLMGAGLNPRAAAAYLYCLTAFLCGVAMLGVALQNEYVTLILGIFGCLVFLLVVTSRRDELSNLRGDLQDRLARGRQERTAAKLTWEAIQRIELCGSVEAAGRILGHAAEAMGCQRVRIHLGGPDDPGVASPAEEEAVSGPSAIFRLSGGHVHWITMELALGAEMPLAADIVFRYMQRLGQALAGRIERLEEAEGGEILGGEASVDTSAFHDGAHDSVAVEAAEPSAPRGIGRIAAFLGRVGARGLAARYAATPTTRPVADHLAGPRTPARP